MKKLAILFFAAALAFAQPTPLAPGEVVRVVEVKNASATNISDNLGRIFPGVSRAGNSLIVRGQPEVVDMIEAAIKKLDTPTPEVLRAPNVELTVQMILASSQEFPDAKISADLEATVRQLRSLFQYKSYRLLDTEILRGRAEPNNRFEISGTVPGTVNIFQFYAQAAVIEGPAPRNIRLTNASFGFRFKVDNQYQPTGINGNFDIREGQKTVLGKSNLINSEDAIILVITPKVIE
jgi:hypothetical protein